MTQTASDLGRLFRSSGIYLAGGLLQQAVGFLMLPLYISLLSPAEYGKLEILNTTGFIVLMFLNLGLPAAITKCYHRDCHTEQDRQALLPTALVIGLPALLLGCGILIAASRPISQLLLKSPEGMLVTLLGLGVLFSGTSQIVLVLFRTREEAGILTALSMISVAVTVCLNIGFVYVLRWGVAGVLGGNLIAAAFTILVASPLVRRRMRFAFQPRLVRPVLSFGLLVVPAAIAGWIMNLSDRYILGHYAPLATVGVYGLGYKFGMLLEALIIAPFQLAWPSFAFAISRREDHRQTYARMLTYLMAAGILVVLALTHASYLTLRLIGRAEYLPAHRLVPLVALAYLFNGVHYCVSPGIHLEGKTRFLPMLVGVAALVNIALNLLWIPSFGMFGAAWATVLAFGALALGTLWVSQVLHRVPYEYARLGKLCAAGVTAHALGRLAFSDSMIVTIALSSAAVFSFPLLLLMLGFLAPDEKAWLGAAIIGRLPRRAVSKPAPSLD